MEYTNDGSGSVTFYNVANGVLKRDAKPGDDESRITVTQKGNKKYGAGAVSGRLTKIESAKTDLGVQLKVELKDEDGASVVGMKIGSSYTKTFLKRLPNIDLEKDVMISAFEGNAYDHPTYGRTIPTNISVKQQGGDPGEPLKWTPVDSAYDKDAKPSVQELMKDVAPIIEKLKNLEHSFVADQESLPGEDSNPVEVDDSSEEETIEEVDDLPF